MNRTSNAPTGADETGTQRGLAGERTGERLLLRPEEAADVLTISHSKLYELLASGTVPSVLIGRSRRVPLDALRRWVEDRIE